MHTIVHLYGNLQLVFKVIKRSIAVYLLQNIELAQGNLYYIRGIQRFFV